MSSCLADMSFKSMGVILAISFVVVSLGMSSRSGKSASGSNTGISYSILLVKCCACSFSGIELTFTPLFSFLNVTVTVVFSLDVVAVLLLPVVGVVRLILSIAAVMLLLVKWLLVVVIAEAVVVILTVPAKLVISSESLEV